MYFIFIFDFSHFSADLSLKPPEDQYKHIGQKLWLYK